MVGFSRRFIRVWQRNRDVFFRLWHFEAPGSIAEPLIILMAMGLGLGAFIGVVNGGSYIEFIAPGIIASYGMYAAVFECTYGSFVRMEHQRTYDAIIATPLNIEDVTAGEIFWGATRATLTSTVILIIAAIFQLVHSPWALLVPAVSLLSGLMFASMSIVYTSFVPSIYSFNYYFTLFITPMFFFSGVFFPLSSFPRAVQDISWILPLTSAVHLTRGLLSGHLSADLLMALGIIVGFTVVFFAIALISMKRRLMI